MLVHRVGERWREVARFGSTREANMALDDHIADGARPDEYAVTTLPRTRRQVLRLAAEIVGGVALVLVVAYLLVRFIIV